MFDWASKYEMRSRAKSENRKKFENEIIIRMLDEKWVRQWYCTKIQFLRVSNVDMCEGNIAVDIIAWLTKRICNIQLPWSIT